MTSVSQKLLLFWQRLRSPDTFVGQVGLTLGANIAIAICGVLTGVLSARLLGPAGRGELAAIQSWALLFASLSMLGLEKAVTYYGSRRPEALGTYIASALGLIVLLGSLVVAAGWWWLPLLLPAQSAEVIQTSRIVLILIAVIYAFFGLPHQSLQIVGAWYSWNILRVLPGVAWLALLAGAMATAHTLDGVTASYLFVVANLVPAIPFAFVAARKLRGPFTFQANLAKPLLRYALPNALQVLPYTLNQRLDQMLMASFLEPQVLGLYAIAVLWSSVTTPIIAAFGPVLFPSLSAISDRAQQRSLIRRAIFYSSIANAIITGLWLLATPLLLPLVLGNSFAAAIPTSLVLIVAIAISNTSMTLAYALRGLGKPQPGLISDLLGLVITGIGLALFLRLTGIFGAAVVSFVSYSITCGYLMLILRRAMQMR